MRVPARIPLIEDAVRGSFSGVGKPASLRYTLYACWFRKNDQADRLSYKLEGDTQQIALLRDHY
ncbi:type II toxin-antitoxin system YoeB family toxin [Algiphilus sp.]